MAKIGVKICGVRDVAALDAAVEAGADWIGLVFFVRSPRYVTTAAAAALYRHLQGRVPMVGLFVDPTEDEIAHTLAETPLDILQLYVDADRAVMFRRRFGLPVWLAQGVAVLGDLPTATGLDGLVIEAKPPRNSDRPGGNGTRFDWSMLHGWTAPSPWLLAGGLDAGNVGAAIQASGAQAVDVSSGVESSPGHKDPGLMRAFIAAAKACQ